MFATFSQFMKLTVHKGYNRFAIATINYFIAALAVGLYELNIGICKFNGKVLWLGILAGISFTAGLMAQFRGIGIGGLSVTQTVSRLSVLVPISLSIIIWHETPSSGQIAGILFIVLALVLLSKKSSVVVSENSSRWSVWIVLSLFIPAGASSTMSKLVHEVGLDDYRSAYLFVLYISATVLSGAVFYFKRDKISRVEVLIGVLLGLCNVSGVWSLLIALSQLKGVVAFPFMSSGAVIIVTILSTVIWKEHLPLRGVFGILCAAAALILINL